MASQKQAARGAFWSTVERASTQGISFVVVLILARLLGPANYGLVTLAATIALLGQTLLGETFSQALIQHQKLEPDHVSSLFWVLSGAGVAATLAMLLGAGWLAELFGGEASLAAIIRALSPLLLLTALQAVPMAIFRRDMDFRSIAVASTSGTLLGGIVGVGLAFDGFGPWSLVANLLVQNGIIAFTIWRRSPVRVAMRYSHRHLKDLWSYGQFTFLLRIAAFSANQGPRIIVGYLFGPAELGAFSLGLRIVEIMYQLLALPAANVAIPMIAKVRSDPPRLERAIVSATQLAAMISMPAYIGVALVAPVAVPFIFGPQWTKSIVIVQLLATYGIVGGSLLVWGSIIGGLGRPDRNLILTTVAAVVSVGLLLLTAPLGITASSAVFVVRGFVMLPLFPLVIARLTGIGMGKQFAALGGVVVAALIMGAAVQVVMMALPSLLPAWAVLAVAVLVAGGSYLGALSLVARPALMRGVSVLADLRPSQRAT